MNSIKIAVSQGMLRLPTEHGFALSSLRYGGRGPTEPRVKTLSEYSFPFAGKPARRLVLPAASWRLSSAPPCRYSVRVVDPLTNIDASRPSAGCAVPFGCRTYGAREPALFSLSDAVRVAGGNAAAFECGAQLSFNERRPLGPADTGKRQNQNPALFLTFQAVARHSLTAGTPSRPVTFRASARECGATRRSHCSSKFQQDDLSPLARFVDGRGADEFALPS